MNTFAGIVSEALRECDIAALRSMLPPQAGCEVCRKAAFGALAGADGSLPIRQKTEDRRRIIVLFSGCLDNVPTLRRNVELHGRRPVTDAPEELLIHLYEIYGNDFFNRLRGSFAIALYDTGKSRLLLGRDLIGSEPLYYFIHRDVLVFSGNLGVLARHPLTPRELDDNAVSTFLSLQYIPAPDTIFRNVRKLAPGHLLEMHLESGNTSIRAFANFDFSVKNTEWSFAEAQRELRRCLEASVADKLANGNVGVFLSGGLDSTVLAALAARHSGGRPVEVFTVGFDDAAYDERALAEATVAFVNRQCGGVLRHHVKALEPLPLELARDLAELHGEPYADASVLPTHMLCEFASGQVSAALGGDGGDEFFAGYERYRAMRIASQFETLPDALRQVFFSACSRLFPDSGERTFCGRCRRMCKLLGDTSRNAYFHLLDRCPPEVKTTLFGPKLRNALWYDPAEVFSRWEWELTTAHPAESLSELDIHTYLPGDGCAKLNIASARTDLEVVTPYLSRAVTDLAVKLPFEYKMRGRNRKRILKAAFADILPPDLAHRRKRGFGVPIARWLRGHWRDEAKAQLFDSALCRDGFIESAGMQRIWDAHQSGRSDFSYLLWSLLNFAWFVERSRRP